MRFRIPSFRRNYLLLLTVTAVLLCCAPLTRVQAESPASTQVHGLLITPLRQYLKTAAGTTVRSNLSVTNLTNNPLDVHLSVQQFSVTDYTYNYQFTQPNNDWLHLDQASFNLLPHHSKTVNYQLNVPDHTAPGGRYYTLFASADLADQGIHNTIQAADLLYLTVSGNLTYTSDLRSSSIGHFSFGQPINYELKPINTGNVYFFAYTSGQLHGLSTRAAPTPEAHMLMPGAVRKLTGSIPAPVLPGIYKATYGYSIDNGPAVQRTSTVLFIPPWSAAFLIAFLLILGAIVRGRRHGRRQQKSKDAS
jgi:hypothetical protein